MLVSIHVYKGKWLTARLEDDQTVRTSLHPSGKALGLQEAERTNIEGRSPPVSFLENVFSLQG